MPAPTIPRTQIPKFTTKQMNTAELCARALWYGIDFETGLFKTSDTELLDLFAPYFYQYHQTRKKPKPDIFVKDVHTLINAAKIKMLYRGIAEMDFRKGINAIYKTVYPIYLSSLRRSDRTSTHQDAVLCLEKLSKGFVIDPNANRLSLASRVLFYISPNIMTFNMNSKIAIAFGLQWRPYHCYAEYFALCAKGLVTNQTKLSRYSLPERRPYLDLTTWSETKATDWWKRRVLDIALLLHLNLATPIALTVMKRLIREQRERDALTWEEIGGHI